MKLGVGRGKGAEDFLLFSIPEQLNPLSRSQKRSVSAFVLGEIWDPLVKLLLTRPGFHSRFYLWFMCIDTHEQTCEMWLCSI